MVLIKNILSSVRVSISEHSSDITPKWHHIQTYDSGIRVLDTVFGLLNLEKREGISPNTAKKEFNYVKTIKCYCRRRIKKK